MKKEKLKKWQELPIGGLILDMGNSSETQTGDWNPNRLVWNEDTCTHCLLCWINCPDASIKVENSKVIGIDNYHCKVCGICVEVCPTKPKSLEIISEEVA